MSAHISDAQADPSALPAPAGRRRQPGRVRRLAGFVVGIALVAGLAALGFWLVSAWRSQPGPAAWQRQAVTDAGLVERSGVQIVRVALTGGGGLIDLRFQVVDPDKAAALHDLAHPPALVDDASGLVVHDLLMGHAHTGPYVAGHTYYLVFENPGNLVQSGGQVSVLLGNAEVDHVAVR